MYPVLCQRIQLKIFFGSTLYASNFLPLSYATSEDDDGFLPKFGPAFLHMYDTVGMEDYKGSILFSLRTKAEMVSAEDKKKSEVIAISESTGVKRDTSVVFLRTQFVASFFNTQIVFISRVFYLRLI